VPAAPPCELEPAAPEPVVPDPPEPAPPEPVPALPESASNTSSKPSPSEIGKRSQAVTAIREKRTRRIGRVDLSMLIIPKAGARDHIIRRLHAPTPPAPRARGARARASPAPRECVVRDRAHAEDHPASREPPSAASTPPARADARETRAHIHRAPAARQAHRHEPAPTERARHARARRRENGRCWLAQRR